MMIEGDLTCVHCRYNLRGLTSSGRCPECGESIAVTLAQIQERDEIESPKHRIIRGAVTLRASIYLLIAAIVVGQLPSMLNLLPWQAVSINLPHIELLAILPALLAVTCGFVGVSELMTVLSNEKARFSSYIVAFIGNLVSFPLAFMLALLTRTEAEIFAALILLAPIIAIPLLIQDRVRSLLRGIGDKKTAKSIRIAQVIFILLAAGHIVVVMKFTAVLLSGFAAQIFYVALLPLEAIAVLYWHGRLLSYFITTARRHWYASTMDDPAPVVPGRSSTRDGAME